MTETRRNWWEIDESRPYGFISYAHYDKKRVDQIAYHLIRDGYPVWMDHDIVSGTDWSEYIAEHLKNASYAIIFLSESSIRSENVRDEINFARNEGKPLIVVYLDDVRETMPKGFHLSLDRFQAVYAFNSSFDQIMHDLEGAVTFRRRKKQVARTKQTRKKQIQKAQQKKKKNRTVIAGVIAVTAAAVIILAVTALRKINFRQNTTAEETPAETQQPETVTQPTTAPQQNTPQSTQKTVQTPAASTTDYTFSGSVLSSRFGMTADNFRSFVAQQGTDVSGLTAENGNVVVSLTDDQKNSLLQALEANASSAASQMSGDVTAASYESGYSGVDLTISGDQVSSDDQSFADTLKAYGILIQSLNDSSSSFKVTFSNADGLISTESY